MTKGGAPEGAPLSFALRGRAVEIRRGATP